MIVSLKKVSIFPKLDECVINNVNDVNEKANEDWNLPKTENTPKEYVNCDTVKYVNCDTDKIPSKLFPFDE